METNVGHFFPIAGSSRNIGVKDGLHPGMTVLSVLVSFFVIIIIFGCSLSC